ncbi:MAG: CsgG/HfaB family protein [Halanaerobiales bacterium]
MQNRKTQIILLTILIVTLITFQGHSQEKVGVLDFSGDVSQEYLDNATNRLSTIITQLDRFEVIDRTEVDRILEEQKFQQSGLVDTDTSAEIGNILGTDQVLVGTIDNLSSSSNEGAYDAEARVTVKIIDVENASVLHSIENSGTARDSSSNEARQSALDDALGEDFVNKMRERFAITATVTNVQGDKIDISGGSEQGVKENFRFRIMRPESTDADLEDTFTREIGIIETTQVRPDASRGEIIVQEEAIKEGDYLEEVPYTTRSFYGAQFKTLKYSATDDQGEDIKGTTPNFGILYLRERPFDYSYGTHFGLSFFRDLTLYDVGFQGEKEFAVVPGEIYLVGTGTVGLTSARQPHDSYSAGWFWTRRAGDASARSFFFTGGGGIKYYTDYDRGMRINATMNYRLAGNLDNWEGSRGDNVNDHVDYPSVNTSGINFKVYMHVPFETDFDFLDNADMPL